MTEQQNHLAQFVEQRTKLAADLDNLSNQSTRTRELFLKTQGAIEYLNAIGVELPQKEAPAAEGEAPTEEAPAE